ncbi:hypothetical protein G5V59_21465 [Nocardioides sp. W3-2-3]|uniref:hypothetical protein n=1 Tax=Nocardioides convexus TaxID=2712224 RepID=UPI0024188B78|nr:hypothetical protein [Nocardioides convexus]NHA01499.1 hypothetical protein [Nocardioides convexus]
MKQAGGVHPLTGFAIATERGGDVRVALAFEQEDQARADADSRSQARRRAGAGPGRHLSRALPAGEGARRRHPGDHGARAARGSVPALRPQRRAAALRYLLAEPPQSQAVRHHEDAGEGHRRLRRASG